MSEQQELLTRLVEESYNGHRKGVLQPISPYLLADRGIYRVMWDDDTSSVLRAFRTDVTVELTGHAVVLDYLKQHGFAAPLVMRTRDGALLAYYEGWTALLLSFLEGDLADFTSHSLQQLANCTGSLHTLSYNIREDGASRHLPDSFLRPTRLASSALDHLSQALPLLPDELIPFCQDAITSLHHIQQAQLAGLLPETIVHGDCWPGNAIRTPGGMALIDWDGAGIGPALLDVGYLLLTSHLGKPQLPTMQADKDAIAAVVHGYCQQRKPQATELNLLEDAIRYTLALRVGLEKRLTSLSEKWTEDVWLQKMLARYHVSANITAIAQDYFEQEI
ncbi:phosphotransferase enzyme family protein [Tengunoibacter tsumagoiensis]|uniref:Aminoglycoside phosphotransferase domain-containing protein n=1 Tax=Tengunoibacter tsumagoiensis TaxID=2014871 RepID=A0A402A9B5_9CHLR|nr:phosphotransferase [Tengunoibacter tsumagoiensis]GCE15752.1 hypothetical protein KTT_56110 [Tengunoibacter tsumagoiensis]